MPSLNLMARECVIIAQLCFHLFPTFIFHFGIQKMRFLKSQPFQGNTFEKVVLDLIPLSSWSFLSDPVAAPVINLFPFRLSLRIVIIKSVLHSETFLSQGFQRTNMVSTGSQSNSHLSQIWIPVSKSHIIICSEIIISILNSEIFLLNWFLFFF